MSAVCPAGHVSDEADYCSVCGAAIVAATPVPASAVSKPPRPAGLCPVCGEARDPEARFCEVCRYDFVAKTGGPPPASVPVAPPSPAPAAAPSRWVLVLSIDPALDTEPDPATPAPAEPERVFPVEGAEMLVGRRDDRQNIRPSVPVHDPGASRRHLRFVANADGSVSAHDLASTNGTKLNGVDMVSGSIVPLREGDEVTLGRWTRIRLRART